MKVVSTSPCWFFVMISCCAPVGSSETTHTLVLYLRLGILIFISCRLSTYARYANVCLAQAVCHVMHFGFSVGARHVGGLSRSPLFLDLSPSMIFGSQSRPHSITTQLILILVDCSRFGHPSAFALQRHEANFRSFGFGFFESTGVIRGQQGACLSSQLSIRKHTIR